MAIQAHNIWVNPKATVLAEEGVGSGRRLTLRVTGMLCGL